MDSKGFVTIAIHSPVYGAAIVSLLKAHGISVRMENYTVGPNGDLPVGLRIMVPEADVLQAVKVAESGPAPADATLRRMAGKGGILLIPIDFSDYSMLAVKAGFEFARRLSMHPLILHCFASPVISAPVGLDSFSEDAPDQAVGLKMRSGAEASMNRFIAEVQRRQLQHDLIDIPFSSQVSQGLPEEVIAEFCKVNPPGLIVMATRGRRRREAELIGSVTAEVIDTCRVPVFTVPENIRFVGVENIQRLIFFCNLDRSDMLSIDALMSMFDCPVVGVTLIPADYGSASSAEKKLAELVGNLSRKYPLATFDYALLKKENFRTTLEDEVERRGIQLLIVPNKKTNIFSRLFKPGMAHRILFDRDIPMLALPV